MLCCSAFGILIANAFALLGIKRGPFLVSLRAAPFSSLAGTVSRFWLLAVAAEFIVIAQAVTILAWMPAPQAGVWGHICTVMSHAL